MPPPASLTIGQRMRAAADALSPTSETPMLDAELLMAHALCISRARLLASRHERYAAGIFEDYLARRMAQEPVAHILGEWEFYGLPLKMRPPMLVPRPETELLVEVTLRHFAGREGEQLRLLDLCTGSGCIAMALAAHLPQSQVTAIDIHPEAVELARENLGRFGERTRVLEGDLFDALPPGEGPLDAIVSNPPYVPAAEWETLARDITDYEDKGALLSGVDGLDCIRRIVAGAGDFLAPNGLLALEMAEDQGEAVRGLMEGEGYREVAVLQDLAGRDRVAVGIRG